MSIGGRGRQLTLYLIRHGESEGNRSGVFQGRGTFPLTDKGRDQARQLGHYFASRGVQPTRIYSSPQPRALETSRILSEAVGVTEPILRPDLCEIEVGPLTGLTPAEASRRWPEIMDNFAAGISLGEQLEGTETWGQVQERAAAVFDEVTSEALPQEGPIFLVSHAALLVNMVKAILRVPAEHKLIFRIPNTSYTRVALDGDLVWLHELSATPHLNSDLRSQISV